jgi:hypothetical protein
MLRNKISNPTLCTATGAYFRVGEVVLDKSWDILKGMNEEQDRRIDHPNKKKP